MKTLTRTSTPFSGLALWVNKELGNLHLWFCCYSELLLAQLSPLPSVMSHVSKANTVRSGCNRFHLSSFLIHGVNSLLLPRYISC